MVKSPLLPPGAIKMKIIVLYNKVTSLAVGAPEDILADEDTVKTARAIAENLKNKHNVKLFEITENNIRNIKTLKPDLFFNNAFGIGSIPKSEVELAKILEETKIPFTGSPSRAIDLTTDKVLTKQVLKTANLPVPGEKKYPLIVKPQAEDCSLGITKESIVENEKDLNRQITKIKKLYAEEVMFEEYIEGRELNVSVIGNVKEIEVLPISEIVFGPSFKNKPKIVDFAAKWDETSVNCKETVGVCPAKLSKNIENKVKETALAAFLVTGCKNITRVDIRLSKDNVPYILEVNANPGVGPDDGSTRSARAAGLSYPQFLEKIIQVALEG